MPQRVERYVPFDTYDKEYEEHDGQKVVCGAYREESAGEVVKGCGPTKRDGAGVLPGYLDMVRMVGTPHRYMLAPNIPAPVAPESFVHIDRNPSRQFVARFTESEANLADTYTNHRKAAAEQMLKILRRFRSKAQDKMLTGGAFDNMFRGLGFVRDPVWATIAEARAAIEAFASELPE